MNKKPEQSKHYLIINGQKVTISADVEKALINEIGRVRKKARARNECGQVDFQKCRGDCLRCPWHQVGTVYSIDSASEQFISRLVSEEDVEEAVLQKLTMSKIYAFADMSIPDGGEILHKRFEEQMTLRDIAAEMDLQLTAVARKLNRLIRLIQENKNLFF